MLDPWVIEEILKREKERRIQEGMERPQLEAPMRKPEWEQAPIPDDLPSDRGVTVIQL